MNLRCERLIWRAICFRAPVYTYTYTTKNLAPFSRNSKRYIPTPSVEETGKPVLFYLRAVRAFPRSSRVFIGFFFFLLMKRKKPFNGQGSHALERDGS